MTLQILCDDMTLLCHKPPNRRAQIPSYRQVATKMHHSVLLKINPHGASMSTNILKTIGHFAKLDREYGTLFITLATHYDVTELLTHPTLILSPLVFSCIYFGSGVLIYHLSLLTLLVYIIK